MLRILSECGRRQPLKMLAVYLRRRLQLLLLLLLMPSAAHPSIRGEMRRQLRHRRAVHVLTAGVMDGVTEHERSVHILRPLYFLRHPALLLRLPAFRRRPRESVVLEEPAVTAAAADIPLPAAAAASGAGLPVLELDAERRRRERATHPARGGKERRRHITIHEMIGDHTLRRRRLRPRIEEHTRVRAHRQPDIRPVIHLLLKRHEPTAQIRCLTRTLMARNQPVQKKLVRRIRRTPASAVIHHRIAHVGGRRRQLRLLQIVGAVGEGELARTFRGQLVGVFTINGSFFLALDL